MTTLRILFIKSFSCPGVTEPATVLMTLSAMLQEDTRSSTNNKLFSYIRTYVRMYCIGNNEKKDH